MAKSEPLFELVKSLNQTEKRYFKLMASLQVQKKDQNYVKLFESIEKQRVYDEKKVVADLSIKFIAQQKRHLYNKILESLRAYHAKGSVDLEINSLLHDFDILLKKSLLRQAGKTLIRAKKMANQAERFTDLLKINQLETKLLHAENNIQGLNNHIKSYKNEIKETVEKIENQVKFEAEYINIIKWNKEIEHVRNEQELADLQEILNQDIFKSEKEALSLQALMQYHYIKGLYFFFLGEYDKSTEHFKSQLACFQSNDTIKIEEHSRYARTIANYTLLNLKVNDFKLFKEGYEMLCNINDESIQIQNYADYLKILLKLMYLTNTGQFNKAVSWIETNQSSIKELESWIGEKDILYVERNYMIFKSIVAYMGVGEYRTALRYVNNYLNSADKDLKQDSYCVAVVIDLLIHFQLGNADLLEYSIKSAQRFLMNRKRLFAFERAVMKFVKNAIASFTDKQLAQEYLRLKESLDPLKEDRFEKTVFEYFDFQAWLESIITGEEIKEIIAKKYESNTLVEI